MKIEKVSNFPDRNDTPVAISNLNSGKHSILSMIRNQKTLRRGSFRCRICTVQRPLVKNLQTALKLRYLPLKIGYGSL